MYVDARIKNIDCGLLRDTSIYRDSCPSDVRELSMHRGGVGIATVARAGVRGAHQPQTTERRDQEKLALEELCWRLVLAV